MLPRATDLAGRVALVTGAGRMRSIGRAIALALADAGCDVVATGTGRPPERYTPDEVEAGWRDVESVADEIRARGRRADGVVLDVTDPSAAERCVADVVARFGRLDVLVNNAGAARGPDRVPTVELPVEIWQRVLEVNLSGVYYLSRAAARAMLTAQQGGSIVNISSIAGKLGLANTAAYSASKAGVGALTSAMAGELGPHGIRVNAICPGVVDTARLDGSRRTGEWEQLVEQIPLGRAGTGTDIAAATVFLCSAAGAWVTGQQWNVDGGQLTVR